MKVLAVITEANGELGADSFTWNYKTRGLAQKKLGAYLRKLQAQFVAGKIVEAGVEVLDNEGNTLAEYIVDKDGITQLINQW